MIVPAVLALCWAASPLHAQEDPGEWKWALTPYLWLPTIDGNVRFDAPSGGGGGPQVDIEPTDWFELLNSAALFSLTATRGRLGLFADFVYLNLGADNEGQVASVESGISGPGGRIEIPVGADLNLATELELDGLQLMLGAGYAFADSATGRHQVFTGLRYLGVDVTTDWRLAAAITGPGGETLLEAQGSSEKSVELWDGIVGFKGYFALGEGGWSIPYSLDIGTGDSDLVWNASLSLAYRFGWGDLVLGYRHLEYDEGPGGTLQDFSLSGPGFGASFYF